MTTQNKIKVGNRFGKLKVLNWLGKIKKWQCYCDCEKIATLTTHQLLNSQNCDECQVKQPAVKNTNIAKLPIRSHDLRGFRSGRLVVIEYIGKNKRKDNIWKCVCDCGKEKQISASNLWLKIIQSCGCLKTNAVQPKIPSVMLIGQKFGLLTVTKSLGTKNFNSLLKVSCVCGIKKIVTKGNLNAGRSKTCGSTACRKKLKEITK